MSDYNQQIEIAKKVMEQDKEVLNKLKDTKSVTELCAEYPNLNEYIHKLEERLKDYEQFSIRTNPPTKTNMTKLTNTDIDILKILIEHRLSEIEKKSELLGIVADCYRPDILEQISKKLDKMYFS